jgi:hypothetical protein
MRGTPPRREESGRRLEFRGSLDPPHLRGTDSPNPQPKSPDSCFFGGKPCLSMLWQACLPRVERILTSADFSQRGLLPDGQERLCYALAQEKGDRHSFRPSRRGLPTGRNGPKNEPVFGGL